jgi:hypothetical protein
MAIVKQTVEINPQVYDMACRGAALDGIDVAKYLEGVVLRDAEHIRTREFIEGTPRRNDCDQKARLAA